MAGKPKIGFVCLKDGAVEPKQEGSVLRISALERTRIWKNAPNDVRTGISIKIPVGYVGLVHGEVELYKGVVITTKRIEPGCSDEIILIANNIGNEDDVYLNSGDKIAGIMLQKSEEFDVEKTANHGSGPSGGGGGTDR